MTFLVVQGAGEPDDLAGEISDNSDDSRLGPTDFHKTGSGAV
jgi:hypothetical protein